MEKQYVQNSVVVRTMLLIAKTKNSPHKLFVLFKSISLDGFMGVKNTKNTSYFYLCNFMPRKRNSAIVMRDKRKETNTQFFKRKCMPRKRDSSIFRGIRG